MKGWPPTERRPRSLPLAPLLICVVLTIATAVALFGSVTPVDAQSRDPVFIDLTMDQLEIVIGDQVLVTARLVVRPDGVDVPVKDAQVRLLIDDVEARLARTDSNGLATFKTSRDLVAGTHVVTTEYQGSMKLSPVRASGELKVKPWTLNIETVPSVEGAVFSVNGEHFATGSDGIASLDIHQAGRYLVNFEHVETTDPYVTAEFDRWGVNTFLPSREFKAPSSTRMQAGFRVRHLVSFTFIDPLGHVVPSERISSVTLRGNSGTVYTFEDMESRWVESQLLAQTNPGTLTSGFITYAVQSVVIDGVSVVNEAQQRFEAAPNARWQIDTLLFSADFSARDALFGFPVGSGFRLSYPDGQVAQIPANKQATASADALARGLYEVRVLEPPGIAPPAPVAVVRDQRIELKVISYFDLAVIGVVGVSLAAGLFVAGRPHVFRNLHRRTRLSRSWPAALSLCTTTLALMVATGAALLVGTYFLTVGSVSANPLYVPGEALRTPRVPDVPPVSGMPVARDTADGEEDNDPVPAGETPGVSQSSSTLQPLPADDGNIVVDPLFLEFWERHSGGVALGRPLTSVYFDASSGYHSQVFEYVVLEHHPVRKRVEDQIQLRHLGVIDARRRNLFETQGAIFDHQPPPMSPDEECFYFVTTRHTVCGAFYEYWTSTGLDLGDRGISYRESLALFGYPISESFVDPETGWTVQYFERAVLEHAPDEPTIIRQAPLGQRFIGPRT